jgi:hypothetical protein
MFEAIQASYEILLPLVERGETIPLFAEVSHVSSDQIPSVIKDNIFPKGKTQMQTMRLLIQTQVMICRRYEKEMSRLKYPMYSVLVQCIQQPSSSENETSISIFKSAFAHSDRAKFVQSVVELIFRTCLISPLNSEELVSENGVEALASLLDFYINLTRTMDNSGGESKNKTKHSVTEDIACGIILYTVRTLSGVSFYERGRDAIKLLPNFSCFLVNWRRCVAKSICTNQDELTSDALIARYALEGLANMAKDNELQEGLIGSGVVWPLLRYTLMFDATLDEEPSDSSDFDDVGHSVASINVAARLSIRALGVLSGLYGDCSKHAALTDFLYALLTSPIAHLLRNKRTGVILNILNSNIERADLIWNVHMRKQLESHVLKHQNERPEAFCQSTVEELGDFDSFQYNLLKNETKIGGIYVRHFNKGGKEALTFVDNPHHFFGAIVNCVAISLTSSQLSTNLLDIEAEKMISVSDTSTILLLTSNDFLLVMNTLRILCLIEGLLDDALSQTPSTVPSVLLSLLELPQQSEVRERYLLIYQAKHFLTNFIPLLSFLGI